MRTYCVPGTSLGALPTVSPLTPCKVRKGLQKGLAAPSAATVCTVSLTVGFPCHEQGSPPQVLRPFF